MRQRRGELAHHRDAANVRDLLPQELRLLFGLFVRGDIAGGAAYPDWLAIGVRFDLAMGRDPAQPAIRQRQPEFRLVATSARERLRQNLLERLAIVGVQSLQNAIEIQPLRRREAEQLPPLVARPDFVPREIPNPDAKVGGIDGQAHPLFVFAQPGFASL